MLLIRKHLHITLATAALVFGTISCAQAGYVTVDLSSYVDTSYSQLLNTNPPYPTGTSTGLTSIPFNIASAAGFDAAGAPVILNYWGGFLGSNAAGGADRGTTLKITGLSIADATTAYSLINTTFGAAGDIPTQVTFIGTLGSHTFGLAEGTDVRDYNDGVFENNAPATALWYSNGGAFDHSGSNQHLDQQTYDLSALGLGIITEVDIFSAPIVELVCDPNDPNSCSIEPGGSFGGEDTIFSGLTFLSSPRGATGVPEPLTLSLFGAGLAGVTAIRRRKR